MPCLSIPPPGGGGGVLSEEFVGNVQPTSLNLYPIYDQNLWFSLPYLWPDQKYDALFMTIVAGTAALSMIYEGLLLMILSIMRKKVASSKDICNWRLEGKNHTLFYDQNGQNWSPIYNQNGWKTIPFGATHTYIAHIREYAPGKGSIRNIVMSSLGLRTPWKCSESFLLSNQVSDQWKYGQAFGLKTTAIQLFFV